MATAATSNCSLFHFSPLSQYTPKTFDNVLVNIFQTTAARGSFPGAILFSPITEGTSYGSKVNTEVGEQFSLFMSERDIGEFKPCHTYDNKWHKNKITVYIYTPDYRKLFNYLTEKKLFVHPVEQAMKQFGL